MFEKLTIEQYNEILASKAPTPGGGSALAVVGTVACSLTEMAINVTCAKLNSESDDYMYLQRERTATQRAKNALYKLSNDDAEAFQHIIDCMKLPKTTDEEQKHRAYELQKAYHKAALVPLDVMAMCKDLLTRCELRLLPHLNKYVSSDCVIAIDLYRAIIRNCLVNVYANTAYITDTALRSRLEKQGNDIVKEVESK